MKKIFAILLFPLLAHAQPGQVTQYLMNEPATLLDIGMLRLEVLTIEFENRVGLHWMENEKPKFFRADINSRYEPEDDRIYVSLSVNDSEATESQMTEGCRHAMGQLGIWLTKSLPGLFLHIDYDESSIPSNLAGDLAEMIELRCVFTHSHSSEGRFWARRSLAGREMTIGKWEMRDVRNTTE